MEKFSELDIDIILKEKPYTIDTAIYYANQLTSKYQHLYCVVRANTNPKIRKYDIVAFKHYRKNIAKYEVYYITEFKNERV